MTDNVHRINTLLRHISHSELRKNKHLPKPMFTGIKRGGDFPKCAKKMEYHVFGMFLDYYIRSVLTKAFADKIVGDKMPKTPLYELYTKVHQMYFPEEKIVSEDSVNSEKGYFTGIKKFIKSSELFQDAKFIELEPEWLVVLSDNTTNDAKDVISGHPDVVIEDEKGLIICDIKTSGQFNKMRIKTVCQLLAYYCLAKKLSKNPHSVGVILPAQKTIMVCNISNWYWKPYWKCMKHAVKTKIHLEPSLDDLLLYKMFFEPRIGTHITRENTIAGTLDSVPANIPYQIYLAGRQNARFKISDMDLTKTKNLGRRLYVHIPHTVNMSRRYDDGWVVNVVQKHLEACKKMRSKGLVVHCGIKAKDMTEDDAFDDMHRNVSEIAYSATPETPLLLETQSGETGEFLSDWKYLVTFYNTLTDDAQKCVKICVDTCHVFAAGFLPSVVITELLKIGIPIGLVHFNDSRGELCCSKDEHASPGTGYIGLVELMKVASICLEHGIDMVRE